MKKIWLSPAFVIALLCSDALAGSAPSQTLHFPTFDRRHEQVQFAVDDAGAGLRSYVQASTAAQRDAAAQFVRYAEQPGLRWC